MLFRSRDEREEFKISASYDADLNEESEAPVQVDVDMLMEKWVEHCVDQNTPEKVHEFSISAALPLLNTTQPVQLVNSTLEAQNEHRSVVYISEEELRRLWIRNAHKTTGKPQSQFSIAEALLLLHDEEDAGIIGEEESEEEAEAEAEVEEVIVTEKVR